ncbi:MAG: PA14 domain-containing protein, partial [Gemmataceae bacterium]
MKNAVTKTQAILANLTRWFERRTGKRGTLGPARTRLGLEVLEGREVPAGMAVGMNLESVNDWSTAWTFTDAFKTSRPWISHVYNTVTGQESWEGGGVVHVDSRGWPTQLNHWNNAQGQRLEQRLGTLMFRDIGTAYPAGVYRAEWEGTGTVNWGFAATVTEQGQTSTGKNYALLQVQPSNDGIYMKISNMDVSDPIRDVHLWMPDFGGTSFAGQVWQPGASFSPFHPLFLEKLAPFRTIRFMDWMETNLTDITTWTDRRPYDHATQQSGDFKNGVAPEYLVELCNELDADAWVNMPHAADDTYVRNFATLVRDTLEPGRKVYVEWSNELWNGGFGFQAYPWVTEQLARPENANLNGDRWAFVGREAKRDFDIWSDVFSGQTDRMVRVVAGQQANSWIAEQIASNMAGHFDAISSAAYMYVSDEDKAMFTASTTADQVIDAVIANLPTALGWLQDHRDLADRFATSLGRPIPFVAYEGGPHLDSWGGSYQQPFFDAGNSPRMYDAYALRLSGARDRGLDLFQHFNLTGGLYAAPYGAFGALQSMTQDVASAPKYRAVLEAAQAGNAARPTISVEVLSAVAQETGSVAGSIKISRTGPTDQALIINHTLAGTASAGDYTGIPASITFAVGESEKILSLTPVDDSLIEGNETVVFKLGPSLAYNVNGGSGLISITDNDLNTRNGLRAWYYDNANFTNRRAVQVDPSLKFFWKGESPVLGVSPTSFSVRWVGKLKAIEAGYYTLRAFNDNGVRVWVNGQLVIDNWTTRAAGFST